MKPRRPNDVEQALGMLLAFVLIVVLVIPMLIIAIAHRLYRWVFG